MPGSRKWRARGRVFSQYCYSSMIVPGGGGNHLAKNNLSINAAFHSRVWNGCPSLHHGVEVAVFFVCFF